MIPNKAECVSTCTIVENLQFCALFFRFFISITVAHVMPFFSNYLFWDPFLRVAFLRYVSLRAAFLRYACLRYAFLSVGFLRDAFLCVFSLRYAFLRDTYMIVAFFSISSFYRGRLFYQL